MPSVLQDWLQELPLMQQTTVLTAIRGPDGNPKYATPKLLLRWYRRCVLISALDGIVLENPIDPRGGSFTGPSLDEVEAWGKGWLIGLQGHVAAYVRELDAIPAHFQRHFMHGIEILGYKHPVPHIREFWNDVYVRLAKEMHLTPETKAEMNKRLSDNVDAWLASSDAATNK